MIDTLFADRYVNLTDAYQLPLSQTLAATGAPPADVDSFQELTQVNTTAVVTKRSALFAALQSLGVNGWTNDPLPQMAATPGLDFADEPLEGQPASLPSLVPVS